MIAYEVAYREVGQSENEPDYRVKVFGLNPRHAREKVRRKARKKRLDILITSSWPITMGDANDR